MILVPNATLPPVIGRPGSEMATVGEVGLGSRRSGRSTEGRAAPPKKLPVVYKNDGGGGAFRLVPEFSGR